MVIVIVADVIKRKSPAAGRDPRWNCLRGPVEVQNWWARCTHLLLERDLHTTNGKTVVVESLKVIVKLPAVLRAVCLKASSTERLRSMTAEPQHKRHTTNARTKRKALDPNGPSADA